MKQRRTTTNLDGDSRALHIFAGKHPGEARHMPDELRNKPDELSKKGGQQSTRVKAVTLAILAAADEREEIQAGR